LRRTNKCGSLCSLPEEIEEAADGNLKDRKSLNHMIWSETGIREEIALDTGVALGIKIGS